MCFLGGVRPKHFLWKSAQLAHFLVGGGPVGSGCVLFGGLVSMSKSEGILLVFSSKLVVFREGGVGPWGGGVKSKLNRDLGVFVLVDISRVFWLVEDCEGKVEFMDWIGLFLGLGSWAAFGW